MIRTIALLLALTFALTGQGCTDLQRTREYRDINYAALRGMGQDLEQVVYDRVRAVTGGLVCGEHGCRKIPGDDDAAAALLEEVQDDATRIGRAVRAMLVDACCRRDDCAPRLPARLEHELAVSEERFLGNPDDLLECLLWSRLALRLGDGTGLERVAIRAAETPAMLETIRMDHVTLRQLTWALRGQGSPNLACRIDWPEDVRRNAAAGERLERTFNTIMTAPAAGVMFPIWAMSNTN